MRTPENCPYRETEPPAPQPKRQCHVRCGMITGLAGFRVSMTYDEQCPRCCGHEEADNPYTRGVTQIVLRSRVRAGDDPGYKWHNPESTPDAAVEKLIQDYDQVHDDIMDLLTKAVGRGSLTAERADGIATAAEAAIKTGA